jgi:hypothetical protein
MFFFQFSVDLSLFLRISTICIILLSLLCPSACHGSSVSNARGRQSNSTDIAVSTSRSTRATDSPSRAPLVSHSTSTPSSWTASTLSRKHRESNNGITTSTSIHDKSTTKAYRGIPGAAKLEYFRGQDIRTGVIGLFGCTSIIVISRGAVWVSHWWEKSVFFLTSFDEFRKLLLVPLVEGNGDRMPGLGGLADPTQPFEAKYQPRAIIASVKLRDGRYIFEYDDKINYIQDKLKALIPGIRITTYKYARNKKEALELSSPAGKILIQYSATEPNCERKYRVWIEAQEQLEESWHRAEGLPNISSGDVNTCMSSSTITSSGYSTSTSTSSSLLVVETTLYTPSTTSSAATLAPSSKVSTTTTTSAPTSTMSSSQTISTIIPAGATPCPSLGNFNTLDCPDGEDESIAVMGENPVAGGDGFAYNLYSACNNAPVTVMLTWSNGTILVEILPSAGINEFDTPGNLEPCLFWSVAAAAVT